uniref:Variant surface glycoprotein 1125.5631 n=1 Tax=Trypanosoma brucei TaxID=5691 RepID=A0A1J0RCT1_9TRYP|nr:variant surface glycoprotein 1125.5631 [Trypanosoma brucei]
MNMTVSTTEWQNQVDELSQKSNYAEYRAEKKGVYDNFNWEDYYTHWKEARAQTKQPGKAWHESNVRIDQNRPSAAATQMINLTAAKAMQLLSALQAEPAEGSTLLVGEINKLLGEAACGAEQSPKAAAPFCSDITGGATTKATKCTTATAGNSISNDLICLCNVQASDDKCTKNGPTGTNMAHANNLKDDSLAALNSECQKTNNPRPLTEKIAGVIARLAGLLGTQKTVDGKLLLGKTQTNNCQASNEACIDYAEKVGGTANSITTIPWVGN